MLADRIKYPIWVLIGTLLLVACGDAEKEKIDALEKEVMAIHDEVMPKSSKIMEIDDELSGRLKNLDSLDQAGVTSSTLAEQRILLLDLKLRLNEADSLMMDWMYEYNGDSARALSAEKAQSYFQDEKNRISAVKEKTVKAIENAESFLKKSGNGE